MKVLFAILFCLLWQLPGLWAQSSPTPTPPAELDPQIIKEFEQQQQNSDPTVFVGNWDALYGVDGGSVNQKGPNPRPGTLLVDRGFTINAARTDGFLIITNKTPMGSKYDWMWQAPLILQVDGNSVHGVWCVYQDGGVEVTGVRNGSLIELKSGYVEFRPKETKITDPKNRSWTTITQVRKAFRGGAPDASGLYGIRISAKPKDGHPYLILEYYSSPDSPVKNVAAAANALGAKTDIPKPPIFYFRAEGNRF